jgi:hypothetical protein
MSGTSLFNTTGATFASTVCGFLNIIYTVEWLLSGLAVAVFFVGIIKFIRNAGNATAHKQGYSMIVWGLIALFVIFSLQGILSIAYTSFLGTNTQSGATSCPSVWTGGAPT